MKSNIYKLSIVSGLVLSCTLLFAQQRSAEATADTTKALAKINVAYGQVAPLALTYSISSVKGADIVNNSSFLAGNSLFGKLPGLTVIQRSSEPGNDAPTFYLRGRSTTGTTTPLTIVDGIERNMNDVQLEDIESITVLKDAASSVIYGIRGANGVILVTTKRGKEAKLRINGNVEQGIMTPTRTPEFVSSAEYVKLYNQALIDDGFAPQYTPAQIAGYESGSSSLYPNVNWVEEVTKKYAPTTRANFNVGGGEKVAKYYVSLGYFHQGGIYKNTDLNDGYSTNLNLSNVSFRSNLDLNVNKNWVFGLDLNGRVYEKNSPVSATSTTWDLLYKYPAHLFPAFVNNGVYGGTSIYPNNPLAYINGRGYRQTNSRVILSTLSTKYDFNDLITGLNAGLKYSTDNFYSNEEGYTKSFAVSELLGADATGKPILSSPIGTNTNLQTLSSSGYPFNDLQNKRNTFEGNIQYSPKTGFDHTMNSQLIYHQDRLTIGSESPYAYQFVAGRVNYGFRNKYFAELGASYSGTEAFAKGHRFGFFPALSAGWVVSEESFLKNNSSINLLKLRASAGSVGNSAVGERFSYLRQYVSDVGYNFGNANAAQSGLSSGIIPNADYTWETAKKYDAGLDAHLFNAVDFSFTYFFQKRNHIGVSEKSLLPGIFGADLTNVYTGITNNHGFESSLGIEKQKSDWGYRVGLNVSYATDKVQYFPEASQPYSYLYRTGNRINQPFMLEALGFFNSTTDIQTSPVQTFGAVKPGDIKYKDQNNDGRIDSFDEIAVNNTTLPSWDMGFDLGFNFKRFEINAFFQGQAGRSIYLGSEPLLFWPLSDNGGRISTYASQYWTTASQATADAPRLTTMQNGNNYRQSTFWYVKGDFLRLRTLDLGYNLPLSFIKHAKMQGARIYVRGMNVFTFDHLKYTDPEVLSGYPVMKSFHAGINLQF